MKKVYYGLFAGLLALAGCTNDEFQEEIGAQGLKSFNTINVTLGEGATTRAYISNPASSGTLNLAWNEYDEIAVFSDTQTDFTSFRFGSASGEKATFVGNKVEGNTFYVVYPYWQLNLDGDNPSILRGYLNANILSSDDYRFNVPMVAKSTDNNFSFKQVAGMIEVTIGDITEIDNASIQGNNREILQGYGYIDMTEAEPVFHLDTTNEGEWTSTSSGVDFWEDKTLASGGKAVTAYFVIAPTEFEKGITLYVNGTDKNGNYVNFFKSTSSPLSVGRAEVKRFSLVNVEAEIEENLEKTRAALEALYDALDGDNWANKDNWKSDKPFSEWYGIYAEGDKVLEINLDNNNLSGSIPSEIGEIEDLRILNLQDNELEGNLPSSIFNLSKLNKFLINGNKLSGTITIDQQKTRMWQNLMEYHEFNISQQDGYSIVIEGYDPGEIIKFEDSDVQKFCVSYWDIDGDRELSVEEAKLVKGNFPGPEMSGVIDHPYTFNEFRYFTGLDFIGGFYYCGYMKEVSIPENITSIDGYSGFGYCNGLEKITSYSEFYSVVDDCLLVDNRNNQVVFYFNSAEHPSITIPSTITSIGEWAFGHHDGVKSVVIPNSVTRIEGWAFCWNGSIETITIPETVEYLGPGSIVGCPSLKSITIYATTPPEIGKDTDNDELIFNGDDNLSAIYVPESAVDVYKSDEYWSNFASIIQAIP